MIGNDIVDLVLAAKESNWRRKGFLQKIFTEKEQILIETAENPDLMVWNLWSRKEAAYKIYNRQTGRREYMPLKLECEYQSEVLGKVHCKGNIYHTATTVAKDFVYTIAVAAEEHFNEISIAEKDVIIFKENGIPYLLEKNTQIKKPVSITHHGRFWKAISI